MQPGTTAPQAAPPRSATHSPREASAVGLPLLGFLIGLGLIISRRPDIVIHPQFWAEDGTIYFGDVYNLGIVHTILRPQAGYFETVPVLAAWIARFFGVRDAPFVMELLALLIQALPVGLLMSRRAEGISAHLWVRGAIALVYLAVPYQLELDATAVNAQWFLAVSALVVLLMLPPRRPAWRLLDGAILLAAGLTGPFAIVLAIVAWLRRWRRGNDFVPLPLACLVTACGILQLASTLVISKHVTGAGIEARPHPGLGASAALFAKLVGGRVLLGSFIGENHGLTASTGLQWAAIAVAAAILVAVARRAAQELWMFLIVGGFVLVGTLINPSVPTPAWSVLAAVPAGAQRYFFLPEFVVIVVFVFIAALSVPVLIRAAAGALVVLALVLAIADHWTYPALPSTGYAARAVRFDHARDGTVTVFPLNPAPWSMSLVRR